MELIRWQLMSNSYVICAIVNIAQYNILKQGIIKFMTLVWVWFIWGSLQSSGLVFLRSIFRPSCETSEQKTGWISRDGSCDMMTHLTDIYYLPVHSSLTSGLLVSDSSIHYQHYSIITPALSALSLLASYYYYYMTLGTPWRSVSQSLSNYSD